MKMFLMKWGFKIGRMFAAGKAVFILLLLSGITVGASTCVSKISRGGYDAAMLDTKEDEIEQLEDARRATEEILELSREVRENMQARNEEWTKLKTSLQDEITAIKDAGPSEPCPPGCVMPELENLQ